VTEPVACLNCGAVMIGVISVVYFLCFFVVSLALLAYGVAMMT
jgi:hypothetical protein